MNETVRFTVTGMTHKEVYQKAEQLWQNYMDDDEAKLPKDTHFEVEGDGVFEGTNPGENPRTNLIGYTANVYVKYNRIGG